MKKLNYALLAAAIFSAPATAQTINSLGDGSAVISTDIFPAYQGSNPAKGVTAAQLSTYFSTLSGINLNGNISFGAGSGNSAENSSIFNTINASGTCTDTTQCFLNQFTVSDTVDASAAANGLAGWYFLDQVSTGAKKGRVAGIFEVNVPNAPTVAGLGYVGLEAYAHTNANLGTGSVFGTNIISKIGASATAGQIIGSEIDVRALSGATYNDLIAQQNIILSDHAQTGTRPSSSYASSSQAPTTPMFDAIFQDGTYTGYPGSGTNTTVFRCLPHANSGACPTILAGIDLTKYTAITGNAFSSPGFAVDGAGNITATSCTGCGATGSGATPGVFLTGTWAQPKHGLTLAAGSTAVTANTLYCVFGGVPSTVTIKTLGSKVTTGASGTMQFGLYSVSAAGTLTLVDSTASTVSTTTATNVSSALLNTTDVLSPATLYAFCTDFSVAPTLATFSAASSGAVSQIGSTAANAITGTVTIGKSIAQTFGTMPATVSLSAMSDVTTTVLPQVGFQVN